MATPVGQPSIHSKMLRRLIADGRLDPKLGFPRKHGLAQADWSELMAEIPDPYISQVPDPVLRTNLCKIRPYGFVCSLEPPPWVVDLIGSSPDAEDQGRDVGAYQDGAALISLFRARWDIKDRETAFPTILDYDYLREREALTRVLSQISDLLKRQLAAKPTKLVLDTLGSAPKSQESLDRWYALAVQVEYHHERWTGHDIYYYGRSIHYGSQAKREHALLFRPFWRVFREEERSALNVEIRDFKASQEPPSPISGELQA